MLLSCQHYSEFELFYRHHLLGQLLSNIGDHLYFIVNAMRAQSLSRLYQQDEIRATQSQLATTPTYTPSVI
jgi:hypothetical protein